MPDESDLVRANGTAPDVLTYGDMPTPVAAPGEVRVKLEASGVNPADVGRRAGSYRAMEFPRVIPDSDGAGIIDQVGDGVTRLGVGQRVWLYNGQRNGRAFGTAAEYITLAEHLVTPLRADVPFAAGATLGIPCMTAWCCLFGDGPIAGQTVLVTGGAGAVGHYAVQLAKWGGARVIATVSSALKAEQARLAGADFTIDYKTEDIVAKAMAFTDQRGVDRVVDVDLGGNIATTLKLMAMNSTIAVYATNGNPIHDSDAHLMENASHCARWYCSRCRRRCWPPRSGYFQMARRRTAPSRHRRTVRALGNSASTPRGGEGRQARHRHRRLHALDRRSRARVFRANPESGNTVKHLDSGSAPSGASPE